ncbi:MAG TPA: preprotein translocase subunit SecY, partial [Candidatus Moranbacteria bacterium]|nr:preprotein translocase subunit SecY [Candidatus Moranbacteria bacterium]
MLKSVLDVLRVRDIRDKIIFVAALLVVFRFFANIPLPGVDVARLEALFADNQLLGMVNIFSGGGLANISIV